MSNTKEQILTAAGWQDLSDVDLSEEATQCCDCDQVAVKAVSIGRGNYWAQCRDCAYESGCATAEAAHRSEYEMDYYAGYE